MFNAECFGFTIILWCINITVYGTFYNIMAYKYCAQFMHYIKTNFYIY